jgi:hypothetical protein
MRYFAILLMTLMFTLAWCAPTQGKNENSFGNNYLKKKIHPLQSFLNNYVGLRN